MASVIHWLEQHALPCWYQQHLGIPCPGCGTQRAFILLLKGDVAHSVLMYPALIPMLLLLVFVLLHLFFKFRRGGAYILRGFIGVNVIIFTSYIFKLFAL